MSDYDTDILIWSERQAGLLRRLALGERVNDQVDWENVIEEVESVGSEQLHAVASLLRRALIDTLKADAIRFRADTADCCAPSMRQRIDIDRVYRQALRAAKTVDGQPPPPIHTNGPI